MSRSRRVSVLLYGRGTPTHVPAVTLTLHSYVREQGFQPGMLTERWEYEKTIIVFVISSWSSLPFFNFFLPVRRPRTNIQKWDSPKSLNCTSESQMACLNLMNAACSPATAMCRRSGDALWQKRNHFMIQQMMSLSGAIEEVHLDSNLCEAVGVREIC